MDYRDLLQSASLAGPIMEDWKLSERIQRKLDERRVNKAIVPYLAGVPAHHKFFNAIVVVPFLEGREDKGTWDFIDRMGAFGCLRLEGSWKLVVVDGQHRFAALAKYKDIQAEGAGFPSFQIGVVFLFWDQYRNDPDIRQRLLAGIRDVFTKLNKTAKKIDKYTALLIDDSQLSYLAARKLVETKSDTNSPFDEDYVKWSAGLNLSPDDPYFTTLNVIASAFEILLQNYNKKVIRKGRGREREEWPGLKHTYDSELEREEALERYYEHHPDFAIGTAEIIHTTFTYLGPLQQWKRKVSDVLKESGQQMPKQPREQTKWAAAVQETCKELRRNNILYTVAGQLALFESIFRVFDEIGDTIDADKLTQVLDAVNGLNQAGFFGRGKDAIWVGILIDESGDMLTDAPKPRRYKPAARVIKEAVKSKLGVADARDPAAVADEERAVLRGAREEEGPEGEIEDGAPLVELD